MAAQHGVRAPRNPDEHQHSLNVAARAFAALRRLAPVFALAAGVAGAAESVQDQMRRIESALGRITQEQQAIYQQFSMAQELRRNDERQSLPLQAYIAPATPPNYDDVKRGEAARAQRIVRHQEELDRLYARYRELEEQKRPLLDTLSALAQQRAQAPEQKPAQQLPPQAQQPQRALQPPPPR